MENLWTESWGDEWELPWKPSPKEDDKFLPRAGLLGLWRGPDLVDTIGVSTK